MWQYIWLLEQSKEWYQFFTPSKHPLQSPVQLDSWTKKNISHHCTYSIHHSAIHYTSVYISIFLCVRMCVCLYICLYIRLTKFVYICGYAIEHRCAYAYMNKCTSMTKYVIMYELTCVYWCKYLYVFVSVCINIWTYEHILYL